MVSQETIEILLRAIDDASGPTQKVDDALRKVGDTAKQANDKASSSTDKFTQKLNETKANLDPLLDQVMEVGNNGSESFEKLSSAEQDSIVKFNMLDQEAQTTLAALRELGGETDLLPGADEALTKLASMDDRVKTFAGSFEYAKSKAELVGVSTDTLRGKIQVVGSGITTYIANKWDSVKTKVTGLTGYIRTQLGNALTHVRSGIDSLGSAFSGLGGIISTAIGGLGMASISQMTVGLAMNRERMTALTSATMGSAEAGQKFVDVMDKLTDESLVSLDDLGQAMSTIKMSTGMSNSELEKFTTTVNDVGQRAILMGKSGDEAMALMQAAGRGLNGEFDMLKTNFGITADQLKDLGWSGAADDVKGYQKALDEALKKGGEMDGMMDTSVGHLETLKKNFRVAGRHVGEMFTPYIDDAVQKLNGLKDSCPGLFENLVMVAGGISMFATVAPTLSPMLSAMDNLWGAGVKVKDIFKDSSIISSFWTTLSSGEGILAAITAGYGEMAIAEYIALGPLLAIIAAIIAIGVAVYELGKYFGWWTDVGTMIQAVWSGINRLWSAFINHPDVQAAIAAISSAFAWLAGAIGNTINWVLDFFNVSQGGEFDIIHAIIMTIGAAWEVLSGHIKLVIQVVTVLATAFMEFYDGTLVPFGSYLSEVLTPVFDALGQLWGGIVEQVQPVIDAFQQFQNGQMSLTDVALTVATSIWNIWVLTASTLSSLILTLVSNILTWAIQAGLNFLNGIGRHLSQVAGRVNTYLNNTKTIIINQLTSWVNHAKQKALQFVNGIMNYIKQLPGKFYSALIAAVSKIISAGARWVSAAKEKAKALVDGVYNKLSGMANKISSALSGVKDAIVKPFQDAYNTAKGVWDKIASLASSTPKVNSSAGYDYLEGQNEDGSWGNNYAGYEIGSTEYIIVERVDGELTIVHDLKNIPHGVDENLISKLLLEGMSDEQVGKALAENMGFQNNDIKIKQIIRGKNNRARGAEIG